MSKIGYYRYKCDTEDGRVVVLYVNGLEVANAEISAVDYCEGGRILKYLDTKGQYRFFAFTKYYEINDSPKTIGSTNEFITSIRNAQTNSKNIGYKNTRTLSISAEVNAAQLSVLSSIYSSPRVFLYIGSGEDTAKDWLELPKISGDTTVQRRKQHTGLVNLTITLPEWFTVKMI